MSLDGGRYRLYALYDPALDNDGMDDRGARVGHTLAATDGVVSTTLRSRPSFTRTANGLVGTSTDPWRDLRRDGDLDRATAAAGPGNVVQAGRIAGAAGPKDDLRATLTLAFGSSARPSGSLARRRRPGGRRSARATTAAGTATSRG